MEDNMFVAEKAVVEPLDADKTPRDGDAWAAGMKECGQLAKQGA